MNDNRLTGEIPAELSGLSELEWLWLGGNSLTGCVPDGLRDVANNDLNQAGAAGLLANISQGCRQFLAHMAEVFGYETA